MKNSDIIFQFVTAVKKRINLGLLLKITLAGLAIGCIGIIIAGFSYVLRGYRCPGWVFGAGMALASAVTAIAWLTKRYTEHKAGHFADDFFDLKDGIGSYIGFNETGHDEGFYKMQRVQVENELRQKAPEVQTIPFGIRPIFIMAVLVLVLTAGVFAFIDDSDQIKEKKEVEKQSMIYSEQNRKDLQEEMDNALDELKKEELSDPNLLKEAKEIKEMIDELKITKDQIEAMRQYAQLEKKLNAMLNSQQQKKDEQLWNKIGQKLQTNRDSKELGKNLTKKDYKNAAKELEKFKQKPNDKSKEAKKNLAKLNIIAQQMANTLTSSQQSESQCSNSQQKQSQSQCSNSSQKPSNSSKKLSDQISKLMESTKQCSQKQCDKNCDSLNESLCDMSGGLKKLDEKRFLQKKFGGLSKKLAQCQNRICSACDSPGNKPANGTKPGGKKAGWGSVDSRTDKATEMLNNDNVVSLEGIKGQGPSEKLTEDSDSGTGSSSIGRRTIQQQYQKQAEAFIQREDIPEELKQGVKHYFENIHQTDTK